MDSCLNHLSNPDTAIIAFVMLAFAALGYALRSLKAAIADVAKVIRGG